MPDRGAKYADKKIAYIDRKLRQTYKTAEVELSRKLNAFNKKFAAKDKEKQKQLAEGKISKQQYKDWLAGQVFQKERFETQIKQIQQVMYHHNQYAADIVNNSRFDVFAENYYAEAFKANWIIQGVSWDIYNTQAIQRLLEDEPDLLPKWKIDQEKDYDWNYQKVNNIVKQGIIQGEGVEDITKRLCEDLSTMNENRMRMFARTAITGAQNAGRQAQMEQAADMGIDVEKRWIATPDNRTRDSHRLMDGEEVPYNEEFSNGLEYPGDPAGDPAEVYNCRCTMQSVYPKYEDRSKQWREGVEIDGVPYEEWKEGKKSANRITDTDEKTAWKEQIVIKELADKYGIEGDTTDRAVIAQIANKVIDNSGIKLPISKWSGKTVVYSRYDKPGYYDFRKQVAHLHKDSDFATAIHELVHSRSTGMTNKLYRKNGKLEEACVETITQSIVSKLPVNQSKGYSELVRALAQLSNITELTPTDFAVMLIDTDVTKRYDILETAIERYAKRNNISDIEERLLFDRFIKLGGVRKHEQK